MEKAMTRGQHARKLQYVTFPYPLKFRTNKGERQRETDKSQKDGYQKVCLLAGTSLNSVTNTHSYASLETGLGIGQTDLCPGEGSAAKLLAALLVQTVAKRAGQKSFITIYRQPQRKSPEISKPHIFTPSLTHTKEISHAFPGQEPVGGQGSNRRMTVVKFPAPVSFSQQ